MISGIPLLMGFRARSPSCGSQVLQLIVGYSGLCLKNQQGSVAVKLITQAGGLQEPVLSPSNYLEILVDYTICTNNPY